MSAESNQDHLKFGERIVKQISDTITSVKEGVKTQPQARSYFYSYAKRFSFSKAKNEVPAFVWQNPRSAAQSIRKIQLIFDDTIADATFAPFVKITCNQSVIFESDEQDTPFLKADLLLEYSEGKEIARHEKLEFFVWYKGSQAGDRKATLSIDLGEA